MRQAFLIGLIIGALIGYAVKVERVSSGIVFPEVVS